MQKPISDAWGIVAMFCLIISSLGLLCNAENSFLAFLTSLIMMMIRYYLEQMAMLIGKTGNGPRPPAAGPKDQPGNQP